MAGGSGSGVLPGGGIVAMDVNAQTVFGFGVGPASVGDVRDAVSAKLGDVTKDTDWYSLPRTSAGGVGDCLADQETRILRWAYDEKFQFIPQTPEDTSGIHLATATAKTAAGASMSLLEVGGPITGIGSTLHFC